MKFFIAFMFVVFAAAAMAEEKTSGVVEAPKESETVAALPSGSEDLKGAEAAYLAYSYAAYPYAYTAYPYVVPPAVFLRR